MKCLKCSAKKTAVRMPCDSDERDTMIWVFVCPNCQRDTYQRYSSK